MELWAHFAAKTVLDESKRSLGILSSEILASSKKIPDKEARSARVQKDKRQRKPIVRSLFNKDYWGDRAKRGGGGRFTRGDWEDNAEVFRSLSSGMLELYDDDCKGAQQEPCYRLCQQVVLVLL